MKYHSSVRCLQSLVSSLKDKTQESKVMFMNFCILHRLCTVKRTINIKRINVYLSMFPFFLSCIYVKNIHNYITLLFFSQGLSCLCTSSKASAFISLSIISATTIPFTQISSFNKMVTVPIAFLLKFPHCQKASLALPFAAPQI